MSRPVSIRRSLLLNLVVVIVLLSVAIFATTVLGTRRAVRTLSQALITRTLDQTEARLGQFFDPVVGGLLVTRSWGSAGLLDADDPQSLNALVVPLMRQYPQVSSLMVADGRGREHMVLRAGGRWSTRQTRRDEWGVRTRWWEWTDENPQPVESWRELDYDPRVRPWYRGAMENLPTEHSSEPAEAGTLVHWTDPYIFFTTKEPGITASLTFDAPPGSEFKVGVIGFDVLLNDITEFTRALRPSPNGLAFVMTDGGRLIGLPRHERLASSEARAEAMLQPASEVAVPVVRAGTRAHWEQPPEGRGAYRFESEGQPWWAGARPFRLGPDRVLIIAVGVPEADMLGGLRLMRRWMIVIMLVVLAGAIARAVVLARRYSRPIEALVKESERISQGDLEGGEPILSSVKEVRRLAEAHDRMRLGLQALMKLERDLQLARQIQQQTFPDRLPALRGFGIEAWSEPADETGGDTYDVVGYQSAVAGTPIVISVEQADRAVLLMADATGHGIGPALSVTQVRSMLRMAVRTGEDLARIALHMNEQLCADLPQGRFITAWLGELDATTRRLTSFSAGQAPLLYYDAARESCDVLSADTLPLGVVEDLEIEVADPIVMRGGDIFAVLSDGIFEATDRQDRQFGTDRVIEVIRANHRRSPQQILAALRETLEAFTQGAPAADDRTGIIIKGE